MPVKPGVYPTLTKSSSTSDQVDGFVVPTSVSQWKKIDDFEGEICRREREQVYLTQSDTTIADSVYLWVDEMEKLEEDKEWSFSYFEKK